MDKVLKIYKALSKPIKASIWFIISSILLKGISFFTLPIFSKLLSTNEYGIVSVYNSWVVTISILTTLTIWGGVFNVGMTKYFNDSYRMISSFQGLAISITLVTLGICLLFLEQISNVLGISKFLTICIFIEVLTQIPFNLWATELRYRFEYRKLILLTCIIAVVSSLLGIVIIPRTIYKAEAKILTNLFVNMLISLFLFSVIQNKGKVFFCRKYWSFGIKFNIVLVPHYLSTQILNQADRIMINLMCGSSDAGIYSVAYNFTLLLSAVTNGINSSLTPYIYQCIKEEDTKKLKNITSLIILLVAIFSVMLICFIPDLFRIMLPSSYYPALKVIPPVIVGTFFLFLYPLFGAIEFYYEETKYITYASMIGAVMNIIFNYIFIKIFGFIAAAYITLICYLGFSIVHYFFMVKILKKYKKINKIYDIKIIGIISLSLIIFSIIITIFYDYKIFRWGIILIFLLFIWFKKKNIFLLFNELKKESMYEKI